MNEYGAMIAGNPGASGNHGLGAGSAPATVEAPVGLLQHARSNISACDEMLSHLHKFADQYAGIRLDEKGASSPAPVPNGFAEELRDASAHLLVRLNMLCQRLSVL